MTNQVDVDALKDVLRRKGFVECDIPACNCGSWHHKYGLPERWEEIKEELQKADVLDNSTGNLPLNAVRKLIWQRDDKTTENAALLAIIESLRAQLDQRSDALPAIRAQVAALQERTAAEPVSKGNARLDELLSDLLIAQGDASGMSIDDYHEAMRKPKEALRAYVATLAAEPGMVSVPRGAAELALSCLQTYFREEGVAAASKAFWAALSPAQPDAPVQEGK